MSDDSKRDRALTALIDTGVHQVIAEEGIGGKVAISILVNYGEEEELDEAADYEFRLYFQPE
jgi:hypothetical protein